MHPNGQFAGGNTETPGTTPWRECSVGGDVFSLRESRSAQQKGEPVCITTVSVDYLFKSARSNFNIFQMKFSDLWRNKHFTRRHINRFVRRNAIVAIVRGIEKLTGTTI